MRIPAAGIALTIEGQEWIVRRVRVSTPDALRGVQRSSALEFTRTADGRSMTCDSGLERGVEVIADRVRSGTY